MRKMTISSILVCFLFCGCAENSNIVKTSHKYIITWFPGGLVNGFQWETNNQPIYMSNGALVVKLEDGRRMTISDSWRIEETK